MYLSGASIVIRNAQTKDAETLCAWWNDGQVMAHAGFPRGLCTTQEKIAESLKTDSDDTRRRLILEYDLTPIGEMSYRCLGNGDVEIGKAFKQFTEASNIFRNKEASTTTTLLIRN